MFNLPVNIAAAAAVDMENVNEEDQQILRENRILNRRLRYEADAFRMLTREEFRQIFRLPKRLTQWLCDRISPLLPNEGVLSTIPKNILILSTLRFYASGTFQKCIGNNRYFCLSQSTVSRVISVVTEAIINSLIEETIKFPDTAERCEDISQGFQNAVGSPGVVGLIDCTHVALQAPAEDGWLYKNYKNYFSLNIQVTCDHLMKITSIDGYPGRTQDARIWRQSRVKEILEVINNVPERPYFLLGDAGYPLSSFILTPIVDARENTPEYRYTRRHTHTRSLVERVFGKLKGRFRCLQKHRVLAYSPEKVMNFFKACAILHNLLIDFGIVNGDVDELHVIINDEQHLIQHPIPNVNDMRELERGRVFRQQIIDVYFG